MAQYGNLKYWNERYTREQEPFDWYQRYSGIRHLFNADHLANDASSFPPPHELRVLVIGCGNSRLSEEMQEDGFGSVTSVDFSKVVIEQMSRKYPDSNYEVMDLSRAFSFADNSFDLIVCKGTMDAMLCAPGSRHGVKTMFTECSRVLGENGALVVVSYGTPENRMVYFESKDFGWTVDIHTVPKPPIRDHTDASGDHYIYICRKGLPAPIDSQESQSESVAEREEDSTRSAETP